MKEASKLTNLQTHCLSIDWRWSCLLDAMIKRMFLLLMLIGGYDVTCSVTKASKQFHTDVHRHALHKVRQLVELEN